MHRLCGMLAGGVVALGAIAVSGCGGGISYEKKRSLATAASNRAFVASDPVAYRDVRPESNCNTMSDDHYRGNKWDCIVNGRLTNGLPFGGAEYIVAISGGKARIVKTEP